MVIAESNGDVVLGPDSGDMWPAEVDPAAGNPSALILEEKAGSGPEEQGDDINMTEDGLMEDQEEEQPPEERHNCKSLSPQSSVGSAEAEPAELETIFIAPLDGSQAELRTRVIKEVRKPGRSE